MKGIGPIAALAIAAPSGPPEFTHRQAFYLIARDGRLYGPVLGEMHVGDARAQKMEQVIDQLLQAPAT
jgi:hypothetical protein